MVQQTLLETIEYLKAVNSADGDIDIYALGADAGENMTADMDERFVVLQLVLINHLLDTVKAANDNIALGLEVNRLMWFHSMGMCQDKEFWQKKYNEHGSIMRFGFDSATVGVNLALDLINKEVADFNAEIVPVKAEWVSALQASIEKFNVQKTHLGQLTAAYSVINDKIERRELHYANEERPDVNGIDLKSAFIAIHREMGAKYAEDAAKANLNVARTIMTRGSFIEQRVIPNRPAEEREVLRKNVSKMRDNITASLERASVWLDVQAINEGYNFPVNPNPS